MAYSKKKKISSESNFVISSFVSCPFLLKYFVNVLLLSSHIITCNEIENMQLRKFYVSY